MCHQGWADSFLVHDGDPTSLSPSSRSCSPGFPPSTFVLACSPVDMYVARSCFLLHRASLSRSSFRCCHSHTFGPSPFTLRRSPSTPADQSGHGHSEAFGVITRVVFPEVTLPRLAKVHAPDTIDSSSSSSSPSSSSLAINGQQQHDGTAVATTGNNNAAAAATNALDAEKEEAAAEAELLDTLVGLVALKGGAGAEGGAQHGAGGGLGAQGGTLGNGRYRAVLSEGREASGKAEESTLLNLLFVPDGRWMYSCSCSCSCSGPQAAYRFGSVAGVGINEGGRRTCAIASVLESLWQIRALRNNSPVACTFVWIGLVLCLEPGIALLAVRPTFARRNPSRTPRDPSEICALFCLRSPMKVLAKALLRLDGLSHVLAWTKDPVSACKDPASLDFVELPRLRLRFEAKADGPGGKVRLVFRVVRVRVPGVAPHARLAMPFLVCTSVVSSAVR